ncbi:hypothetical protein ACROYT_G044161 [Oculina patagonica]
MSCANRFCVNLVAHRHQTVRQSGSLTKMAGFPCSGFFVVYLTAITFLQVAAAMSMERAFTIPDATMPGRNVSLAGAKPHPTENDQLQHKGHVDNGPSCPNCNKKSDIDDYSEDSPIYKLRIEMVKEKILAKLHMDKAPVLKQKTRDSRIAALLSNLNLIEENNEEREPKDADEEDYYGKTTKIIVFSEKAKAQQSRSRRNFPKNLVFQFKLEQKSLSNSVPSAFLWLHKRKSKRYNLNGKTLHLEAHGMKSHTGDTEVPVSLVTRARVKAEKKSGSEWVVVDVKDIVQHWFNKTAPVESSNATDSNIHTIEISCLDCESEAGHLISSRGRLRPFLVIDLDKPRTLNRRKRSIDCPSGKAVECCRRQLYVNFTKIGWDWILYPEGFYANFCDGDCNRRAYPENGYLYMHSGNVHEKYDANDQDLLYPYKNVRPFFAIF